jgi:predicted nucleotidyltransferase
MDLPEKFRPAFAALRSLEQHEEYLGVFIFGSGARGELTDRSDVDAIVVTRVDRECWNISHPIILHYRWRVSSKRMLRDLADWDPALHVLVCDFLTADGVGGKLCWWSKIIDHIAASFGGRLDIENSSCACYSCTLGLALLLDDEQ